MPHLFLLYRWLVFGLLIVFNAIICSVAAWNLGLVPSGSPFANVDGFLIFVSALSLVCIFPIIVVDIVRKNAISSRVWFESCWVAFFWIMQFCGSAAATAVMPNALCDTTVTSLTSDPCTSSKVLIAMSWSCTVTLLSYLLLLIIFSAMHQKEDNQVWQAGVRDFPWFRMQQCLRSPSEPVKTAPRTLSLKAPRPRRAAPAPVFVDRQTDLSTKYEIEHYSPPAATADQPGPSRQPLPPIHAMRNYNSLYPQHVQASISHPPPPVPFQPGPSPPPLGDWKPGSFSSRPHKSRRVTEGAAAPSSYPSPSSESPPRTRPAGSRPRLKPLNTTEPHSSRDVPR
ncbi:hypothetical protein BD410DRAFT_417095 [Rickenella mellea]|uniref:MARVEL domain-containing protein n=1 Tax=Rickenella mellea TaxID=50990 RepID=A0A4Y7QKF9_9AGAM|nr:hypothetical protein BD410DRAFT_417095 [Rickenella mellea]